MRLLVTLDAADCRGWLLSLHQALEAAGHAVFFQVRPGAAPPTRATDLVLAVERRLYGACIADAWAPLDPARLPSGREGEIRIELSGAPGAALTLHLNSAAGVAGLPGLLMSEATPWLALLDSAGEVVATAVPAREDIDSLARSLRQVTTRIGTLVLMALDGQGKARQLSPREPCGGPGNPLLFMARATYRKGLSRLLPDRYRMDHWRVGIRKRPEHGVFEGASTVDGFTWLEDDGERFYADPILFDEAGRTWLFVEEFPYALGRGIISYTELGPDGVALHPPRPVITRKGHLSYPLLFRHEGEIYMMPENAEEGHVPLYRARRFPEEWEELPPVLGVALHDATPVTIDGTFWILGNAALQGGSSWDCLMAYAASGPLGPFTPHPANPLMLDARTTRPGGPVFNEKNLLVRTVQDCLIGYGRFKRFFNLDQLSLGGFHQHERGQWRPSEQSPVAGVHTFSRSTHFEATDARASRHYSREARP